MLRRVNFYSICFAFGLSVVLILAGSRYADNNNYRPSYENRRNVRNFLKVDDGAASSAEEGLLPTNSYNVSPNVESILQRTRFKIKSELSYYNMSDFGVSRLEDLLMEAGGKPKLTMIISTWRSGSTFLGEIINSIPGNYYHYEPLLKYEIVQIRGLPFSEPALSTIKNMFLCNHDNMAEYFEYGKTHLHQFSHNTRLWDHCKYKKELCFDEDFTERFCKLFPFQSMKLVRLRLKLVQQILDDKRFNVKVILLIRDPRGVMQSRQHRSFCQPAADCWKPDLLCADMINDYVAAARIQKKNPDRLMVVRYEELALNPYEISQQILEFLNLMATKSVNEFLQSHTNVEVAGVSSTFRVSREVPFRWKNVLDFDYVDQIQMECNEAMNLWGYRMAHNKTHMASNEFNPLKKYEITL